jgi:hypothetical protein
LDLDKSFICELAGNLIFLLSKIMKSQDREISTIAGENMKNYSKFFYKNIQEELIALTFNGGLLAKKIAIYISNIKDHFKLIY